ncbi:MAG: response regulator [candidate division WOR-3 bacterium]
MTEKRPAVLIVDDQPNWRNLFADLLADEYEITTVGSYEEGRQALKREPPFHVAVVDIRLDDKKQANEDGLRLVAGLDRYTSPIVVTGYPTVRTVREALQQLGAFAYIEKYPESGEPFDRAGFRRVVRGAANAALLKRGRRAYVTTRFAGLPPDQPLKMDEHYILTLEVRDVPEVDALAVWLPPKGHGCTFRVSVRALNMKVQPANDVLWEIPAGDTPTPLRIKLIPKISGRETIFVHLEMDGDWIGSIEKEVNVLEEHS